MKKIFFVYGLLIISLLNTNAQTSWEKLFSANSTDVFRCVREVPAGGYVLAGYTANFTTNDTDAYVVRLNTSGDTTWTFKYNAPLSKKDLFYKVIPTIDGGFALCGYTTSVATGLDNLLYLKLNSSGQQQWVKSWGGSGKERGQDILQTADGNYTIVGYTSSAPAQYIDAFMLRVNSIGDTLWSRRYGAANYDDANTVKELPDGGYILGGQSDIGANLEQYLVRTDDSGVVVWSKRFGTPGTENIDCIALQSDGFILAGSTSGLGGGGDDGYLVKTDTAGTFIWGKTYGGASPDDFHRVELTSDGGLIASGTTTSSGPSLPNMWMVKTNATGDTAWTKTFGGDNHDHGYSAQQTSDGGYIIAGHTGSFGYNYEEAYVVKTGDSGNVVVANKLTYTTVLDLISPTATTCGTANTQIKVVIKNFGNRSVSSVPITIVITGSLSTTLNQTYSSTFSPLENDTVTFTTTINTSSGGTYNFYCYTSNNNDVYPERNSFSKTMTINIAAPAPTVTSNSRCGTGTVPLSASGSATIYWFANPTGGAPVNTGTSYTPNLLTTTTYYVQTGLTCPSARIPVVGTVYPIAADPLTVGASHCGSGSVTLTATSTDTIKWYTVPTGGSSVATGPSYTTPNLTSTTNYYALATNGHCPSNRVLTTATISSVAADPVTHSASRCGPGPVVLTATSADPVIWFDAASGGSQVGSGTPFTTVPISTTTVFYAQADNGCLSNRVATTATVNPVPTAPATQGTQHCGPGGLTLTALSSDPVTWYDAASGGTLVGTGSTFNTPFISTTMTYYAVANNGTCSSSPVATVATILSVPSINLGPDMMVSAPTYMINAGSGFATYQWSTGETTQSIIVNTSDTFCVTVTNGSACSNSDCIIVQLSVGVSEIHDHVFSIYPNPSNGKFNIELSTGAKDAEVEIMNLTGAIIKRIFTNHDLIVDVSDYPNGIYLVRVTTGNFTEVKKVVLER